MRALDQLVEILRFRFAKIRVFLHPLVDLLFRNGLKKTIGWVLSGFAIFLVVVIVAPFLDGGSLAYVARYLQELSHLVAVVDDLIVRLLGVVLVLVGGIGFVWVQIQTIGGGDPGKLAGHYWKLAGYGALLGTGGAAFFGAYTLDSLDNEAERTFAAALVSQEILARWVQVVPARNSRCKVASTGRFKGIKGPFEDCPMGFSVRAVVAAKKDCPVAKIMDADGNLTEYPMDTRGWQPDDRVLGFRTIKVCETRVDATDRPVGIKVGSTEKITISHELLSNDHEPRRIVVLGDTGCRDNKKQRCKIDEWPVAKVMGHAAKKDPGLVLHVGDFMYALGDNWERWRTVFFDPARPLLAAAPWVMVRGNHEGCSKFDHGPHGYSLFFGDDEVTNCNRKNWREATRAVDLSTDLRLIVADTAHPRAKKSEDELPVLKHNCDVKKLDETKDKEDIKACEATNELFDEIGQLTANAETSWLVTHVPVFGLEYNKELKRTQIPETTAMMLAAWNRLGADHDAKKIKAILSGDRHLFQVAKKTPGGLLQITSGAGGVELDPAPDTIDSCLEPKDAKRDAKEDSSHGEGWTYCSNESWGYVLVKPEETDKFAFMLVQRKLR